MKEVPEMNWKIRENPGHVKALQITLGIWIYT